MTDIAVIFDLDDTLYKERDYVESALRTLARETGYPYPALPSAGNEVPAAAAEVMDALASAAGLPVSVILERYRRHIPALTDTEGAAGVLRVLKERGCIIGILTDGRPHTQRAKIAALGLTEIIGPNRIFISGETGVAKPDPRAWQSVADKIPSATHYIYVGDNPAKDFAAPQALGWHTIGIADDGRNIHRQDGGDSYHAPDIWVSCLTAVPDTVESIIS